MTKKISGDFGGFIPLAIFKYAWVGLKAGL
jgi:hypothetical protein